jgi:hypothetical protein
LCPRDFHSGRDVLPLLELRVDRPKLSEVVFAFALDGNKPCRFVGGQIAVSLFGYRQDRFGLGVEFIPLSL